MLVKEVVMEKDLHCKCEICAVSFIPMHMHHAFEIIYILKGSINLTCQAFEYHLNEGDVFICNVNEPHFVTSDDQENIVLFFHLDPYHYENVYPHLSYHWFLCDSYKTPEKDDIPLRQLQQMLWHAASALSPRTSILPGEVDALIFNIVNHLINNYQNFSFAGNQHALQSLKSCDTLTVKRIFEIQEYIYRNYQNKISLEDLSNHLYLNKYYVSRLIKNFTGLNLIDLLGLVRTEKAQILLLTSDRSLEEISFECGFSSVKYFEKYFVQWYKVSPRRYREDMRDKILSGAQRTVSISHTSPKLAAIRKQLSQSAVLAKTAFSQYEYILNLEGLCQPFPHLWQSSIYISDIATSIQLIDSIDLAQCREDIGFEKVELHNLFERYPYYRKKNPFFDAGLLHLIKNLCSVQLLVELNLSLNKDNLDEELESLLNIAALLAESLTESESNGLAFCLRNQSFDSKELSQLTDKIAKTLEHSRLPSAIRITEQHFLRETYSNDSMCLVPHLINHALSMPHQTDTSIPYREMFDIPGEDTKTNIPAFSYNGLFGPFGEKKPLYYAWHLLSLLGDQVIFQADGILVTKLRSDFSILLYDPFEERSLHHAGSPSGAAFTLKFASAPHNQYQVTQISLNSEKSLFQHLKNLRFPKNLDRSDIRRLDQAAAPEIAFSFLDLYDESILNISLNPYSAKLLILKHL
ncbi:AraC family transcriptional regulator [Hominibacterium faecale]|uniref:AraC family transcriptional regulator n=1 Tax=Hominibacterium faecale TaxID=2839743 RepID=UPI0022B296A0|nr:helix-turn-helix domain-containing protein [Hominibacterium faecale]